MSVLNRNLTVGSKGADVKLLQQFLNAQGFAIAPRGTGSKGKEKANCCHRFRVRGAAHCAGICTAIQRDRIRYQRTAGGANAAGH